MFMQIIQGPCRRRDELRTMADRWLVELGPGAPGFLGATYGFTDDGQSVAVVRFDSREAATANAQRPEQQAWWAEMEQLYDGPVEFHDCDRVVLMMDGESDRAGFVQVIRGRVDDPDKLEAGIHDMSTLLHEARPDIVDATLAIEEDGTFIETVAFTTEEQARAGESQAMPVQGAVADAMRAWFANVHDETYLDLHETWFASKPATG